MGSNASRRRGGTSDKQGVEQRMPQVEQVVMATEVAEAQGAGGSERAGKVEALLERQKVKSGVRLQTRFGSMINTAATAALLEDVGTDSILAMTERFYAHVFEDKWIDKFVRSHNDPHGERLGTWIIEKMSGEPAWSSRRPPDARFKAHRDAWTSPKREPEKSGRRFKLDDCRMWMRLMFWSAREEGLDAHEPFWDWYVQFIGHFIGIYERSAPPYARESAEWSADPANIAQYRSAGNLMEDVIGVGVRR